VNEEKELVFRAVIDKVGHGKSHLKRETLRDLQRAKRK